ncbi:hypothetical protein D3C79_855330 [compost metagenome]
MLRRSATGKPVGGVAPSRITEQCVSQCLIPVARPPSNNQPELIKDATQQGIKRRVVLAKFRVRIEDARILIVAVELNNVAAAMDQGLGASQGIHRAHHGGLHPHVTQRILHQPIKIGGDNHPHMASLDHCRYRPMRPGRRLQIIL